MLKNSQSFLGCFAHDTIPKKLQKFETQSGIVNLHNSNQGGSHWVAFFYDPKTDYVEYFDSFGVPPSDSISKMLKTTNRDIIYNSTQLQHNLSSACGQFCVDYIKSRDKGISMYDTIYKFQQKPSFNNDEMLGGKLDDDLVIKFLKNLFKGVSLKDLLPDFSGKDFETDSSKFSGGKLSDADKLKALEIIGKFAKDKYDKFEEKNKRAQRRKRKRRKENKDLGVVLGNVVNLFEGKKAFGFGDAGLIPDIL